MPGHLRMNFLRKKFRYLLRPYRNWQNQKIQIRRNHCYDEQDELRKEFYSSFLKPGDLVFDAGANVGNRTRVFLSINARVLAIEPQPTCVAILRKSFDADPRFELCPVGLDSETRRAEMWINESNTISSFSREWIASVKRSGRFAGLEWNQRESFQMTTLDALIARYGRPRFIKLDIEGFEYEALCGLTSPIEYLSLEFTPEYIENTFKCIEYIQSLTGNECRYQLSLGESMQFEFNEWVGKKKIVQELNALQHSKKIFGDCYIKSF